MRKKKIAVFASGNGTNAQKIFEYFQQNQQVEVNLLCCNKIGAPVLDRATNFGIPTFVFNRKQFYETSLVVDQLTEADTDLVVLAGFMWLVPENLVTAFEGRLVNIHPALLPKYGGKGMYGMHVHHAVKAAGEKESGITIHQVNSRYDEGDIVAQFSCQLEPTDSPEDIAKKVQFLEHENYPKVIENLVLKY